MEEKKKNRKDNVITVRLSITLKEYIEKRCMERKLRKSDYIRELIELDRDK